MIEVTESAQKKIKQFVDENKMELAVRVFLSEGG